MRTRVQKNKSAQNDTIALHKKVLGSQLPNEKFDQNSLSLVNFKVFVNQQWLVVFCKMCSLVLAVEMACFCISVSLVL